MSKILKLLGGMLIALGCLWWGVSIGIAFGSGLPTEQKMIMCLTGFIGGCLIAASGGIVQAMGEKDE